MLKLFLILTGLALAACRHQPFYRRDYVFFDEYDAYYKIHWDTSGISWHSAFLSCDDEGSKLFYPREPGEWTIVKNLTSMMSAEPNVTDIFVGIHDDFFLGEFITVDGQPTQSPLAVDQIESYGTSQCIVMDIETGNYKLDSCFSDGPETLKPYVCKKVDDNPCPTIDRDYNYKSATKKCYKVHNRAKTWHDAMQTCFMEGGLLTVIDSVAESKIILDQIEETSDYFVGFRRIREGGDFYTVKGQNIDTRYQVWRDKNEEDKDDCGVVYRYSNEILFTRSQRCQVKFPFICEMTPKA